LTKTIKGYFAKKPALTGLVGRTHSAPKRVNTSLFSYFSPNLRKFHAPWTALATIKVGAKIIFSYIYFFSLFFVIICQQDDCVTFI
jgi:hypothetical protein